MHRRSVFCEDVGVGSEEQWGVAAADGVDVIGDGMAGATQVATEAIVVAMADAMMAAMVVPMLARLEAKLKTGNVCNVFCCMLRRGSTKRLPIWIIANMVSKMVCFMINDKCSCVQFDMLLPGLSNLVAVLAQHRDSS